jgi:hypothetical protein
MFRRQSLQTRYRSVELSQLLMQLGKDLTPIHVAHERNIRFWSTRANSNLERTLAIS